MTRGLIAIAAGIAVLAGLGTGIGEGLVAAHAVSIIRIQIKNSLRRKKLCQI